MRQMLTAFFTAVLLISSASAFEPLFDSQIDYAVGGRPSVKVMADFNQDGILDLATNSQSALGYLHFLYGVGNGTFDYSYDSTACGYRPRFIGTGRFNSDIYPDFVNVCQPYQNAFYVSTSNGDGTYNLAQPDQVWPSNLNPMGIVDIDNDGFDDLLYMDYNQLDLKYQVRVVFCNGDGTFDFVTTDTMWLPTRTTAPHYPFDVNHDEFMDIIAVGLELYFPDPGNTSVYEFLPIISTVINNGDGTFQESVDYYYGADGDQITQYEMGHFDSDDELDLIIIDDDRLMTIFKNNGDGSFSSQTSFALDDSLHFTVGDFNADGYSDLAYSYAYLNEFSLSLNNADNSYTFGSEIFYPGATVSNTSYGIPIYCEDVNGDNYDDIIFMDWSLAIILNKGDGTFPQKPYTLEGMNSAPNELLDMATGDFNNDGAVDLVVLDEGSIHVSYNNGSGGFGTPYLISPPASGELRSLVSGDFNKDGYDDFGVACEPWSIEGFFAFYGSSTEGIFTEADILDGGVYNVKGGIATEINGDGRTDFAFYASGTEVRVINSFETDLYQLKGYDLTSNMFVPMRAIDDLDLNNDGFTDLVAGGMDSVLYLLYNDGSGSFNDKNTIQLDCHFYAIETAYLNDDGFEDVILGTGHAILVFFSNGDGTLMAPVNANKYYYSNNYKSLSIADINQDGFPDIIGMADMIDIIAVIINNGDGTFKTEQYYPGGASSEFIAVADFNGDTHLDIASIGDIANDNEGNLEITFRYSYTEILSDIIELESNQLPQGFNLSQNYPNPFNPETSIQFSIPRSSNVKIDIYNILGQTVKQLINEVKPAGQYRITWDGRDNSGKTVASGIYFYKITTDNYSSSKKMVLLK